MACIVRRRFVLAVIFLSPALSAAQSPLENCAAQFIDNDVANAPTIGGTLPNEPFLSNVHQRYRDDRVSFFSMEYWPEEFAPRWTAYRLSPENYGADGCATFTRSKVSCYVRADTWPEFLSCENASDPFHADHMLGGILLRTRDFANSGHDNGHIAPRQAFSWHVCGTYQTFTMANMSSQRGYLNQDIWQLLEEQVLTWAFDEGPLYVVTGTTFRTFPHGSFAVYAQDNVLDPGQIYRAGSRMLATVEQHHENFVAAQPDGLLRPMRNADPDRIHPRVQDLRMPTGYFKVIYRPTMDAEPARAAGFLLPHSFENLNLLTEHYESFDRSETFWAFSSRIDLIEEASGMKFPGIPAGLKDV